jgi:hypothetical protein
MNALIYKTVA